MTKAGLKERDLLDSNGELDKRLDELARLLEICKSASEKELSGERISKEENDYFKDFDKMLRQFYYPLDSTSESRGGQWDEDRDELVADVHTDRLSNTCLEEAVGKPLEIFVIAPIDGKPVLFRGGAYSYYEFTKPISERMTDEQWQRIVGTRSGPDRPIWTKSFSLNLTHIIP